MDILNEISGGRVLDVATGQGGFADYMAASLQDYTNIIGIDNSQRVINAAQQNVARENVYFILMDADRLGLGDESLDTVSISNSLHHMANLARVLAEIKRVLKPGGRCIISEMYRDEQTPAQLTHVYLHHWWAQVDSALGITHHETYTRQELVDILAGLGLRNLALHDHAELDNDPQDAQVIEKLDQVIDTYVQRAEKTPKYETLKQRGEALRQRLHDVGFHAATHLIAVGEKSSASGS
jgi:SAM-dependent methyltransferase